MLEFPPDLTITIMQGGYVVVRCDCDDEGMISIGHVYTGVDDLLSYVRRVLEESLERIQNLQIL